MSTTASRKSLLEALITIQNCPHYHAWACWIDLPQAEQRRVVETLRDRPITLAA